MNLTNAKDWAVISGSRTEQGVWLSRAVTPRDLRCLAPLPSYPGRHRLGVHLDLAPATHVDRDQRGRPARMVMFSYRDFAESRARHLLTHIDRRQRQLDAGYGASMFREELDAVLAELGALAEWHPTSDAIARVQHETRRRHQTPLRLLQKGSNPRPPQPAEPWTCSTCALTTRYATCPSCGGAR